MIDKKIYQKVSKSKKKNHRRFGYMTLFQCERKRFSFTLEKGHIPETSVTFLKILTLFDIFFYQSY